MEGLYNKREVLGKLESVFEENEDFDFFDIADRMQDFLTQDQLLQLKRESTPKAMIRKLFFILSYQDARIETFLDILKVPYDWLEERLTNALTNKDRNDLEINLYRQSMKDIPQNGELNVYRCQFVSIPERKF